MTHKERHLLIMTNGYLDGYIAYTEDKDISPTGLAKYILVQEELDQDDKDLTDEDRDPYLAVQRENTRWLRNQL